MKLQPEQRLRAVPDGHDFARSVWRVAPSGDDEIGMERVGLDHQAVIARGFERILKPLEQPLAVMMNPIGFAVHQAFGANDAAARRLSDRLMSQAYAQ